MIIDITGTEIIPGNHGKDCLGNGEHNGFECCCDSCSYLMCCMNEDYREYCEICGESDCVRKLDVLFC